MCGKMKYGKGDGRKRRGQWIFGGVSRTSGRFFMGPCPDNKRTRKALWPIIQVNFCFISTTRCSIHHLVQRSIHPIQSDLIHPTTHVIFGGNITCEGLFAGKHHWGHHNPLWWFEILSKAPRARIRSPLGIFFSNSWKYSVLCVYHRWITTSTM